LIWIESGFQSVSLFRLYLHILKIYIGGNPNTGKHFFKSNSNKNGFGEDGQFSVVSVNRLLFLNKRESFSILFLGTDMSEDLFNQLFEALTDAIVSGRKFKTTKQIMRFLHCSESECRQVLAEIRVR